MDLTVHDLPQSVHRTVHYAPLLPSSNTCTSHPHFYDCILCLHVVQTATPFLLPSHGCALHTINIYSVFTYRTSSTCNTFWKYTHGTNLVFIKYCVFFPLNVVIFLNFASSAAALVFYLPGVCTIYLYVKVPCVFQLSIINYNSLVCPFVN